MAEPRSKFLANPTSRTTARTALKKKVTVKKAVGNQNGKAASKVTRKSDWKTKFGFRHKSAPGFGKPSAGGKNIKPPGISY